ncbi:MAG: class I SAM-dependent methyltransferase [Proteobacteria bacterium]|nr:class I SAM-dependent methyltransferase [Pseudomonadota bacterium]
MTAFRCAGCRLEFPQYEGVPCLLADESEGSSSRDLRAIYDEIYKNHENVWVDQGRSSEFLSYFGALTRATASESVLEVGCGEGQLLRQLAGREKYGIDPSLQALLRAQRGSSGKYAVARAEELPFASGVFDLAISVGVMEHFQDVDAATSEIWRVLKSGGRYVALIQTDMTKFQRLGVKLREYLLPPRPIAFVRWLGKKASRKRIVQPFRKSYTVESATECLRRNGLSVSQVVNRSTDPRAPLAGNHVVVLIARKA